MKPIIAAIAILLGVAVTGVAEAGFGTSPGKTFPGGSKGR
jgi:hypothetical protein